MRLSLEYDLPTLKCPVCGVGLNIEATYEDRREDCKGKTTCPNCDTGLHIASEFKFVIKALGVLI
jgi:hypothetical protein